MVKKCEYGKPFETYAVVNSENISEAAENDKKALFVEAAMEMALEPYGGITWDRPEDGNDRRNDSQGYGRTRRSE